MQWSGTDDLADLPAYKPARALPHSWVPPPPTPFPGRDGRPALRVRCTTPSPGKVHPQVNGALQRHNDLDQIHSYATPGDHQSECPESRREPMDLSVIKAIFETGKPDGPEHRAVWLFAVILTDHTTAFWKAFPRHRRENRGFVAILRDCVKGTEMTLDRPPHPSLLHLFGESNPANPPEYKEHLELLIRRRFTDHNRVRKGAREVVLQSARWDRPVQLLIRRYHGVRQGYVVDDEDMSAYEYIALRWRALSPVPPVGSCHSSQVHIGQ